jgi:3-oxoacyl-[acyl-carrier protein] reductase
VTKEEEDAMGSLDGRVALVTGSGRGIAAAVARKLADGGARVVVGELDLDAAAETVATITVRGVAPGRCCRAGLR